MKRTLALAALLLVAACGGDDSDGDSAAPGPPAATSPSPTPTPTPTFGVDDFAVQAKETERQCFGEGVGCNVSFRAELSLVGFITPPGRHEITYVVSGGKESVLSTFILEADGTFEEASVKHLMSVPEGQGLKVKITEVEKIG